MKKSIFTILLLIIFLAGCENKNKFNWYGYTKNDKDEIKMVIDTMESIWTKEDYSEYFRVEEMGAFEFNTLSIQGVEWEFNAMCSFVPLYFLYMQRTIKETDVKYIDFVAECFSEHYKKSFFYIKSSENPIYFAKVNDRVLYIEKTKNSFGEDIIEINNAPYEKAIDKYGYLMEKYKESKKK